MEYEQLVKNKIRRDFFREVMALVKHHQEDSFRVPVTDFYNVGGYKTVNAIIGMWNKLEGFILVQGDWDLQETPGGRYVHKYRKPNVVISKENLIQSLKELKNKKSSDSDIEL